MSVEFSPEESKPTPEAKRLLHLKEQLTSAWQELPPDHKASMALVLLEDVMEGEDRLWLREALDLRWPVTSGTIHSTFALIQVSRDDLQEIGLDEDEIALFDDDQLKEMAGQIREHYVVDGYWQELKYHTAHLYFLRDAVGEQGSEG